MIKRRNGFSLLEVAIATMIMAVLLVASMQALLGVVSSRALSGQQVTAAHLSHLLRSEIVTMAYEDPDEVPTMGLELSEVSGDRTTFDDVDDFDGWIASPPQHPDGTSMLNLTGWERKVTVEHVDPTDPDVTSVTDQGVKRITIEVRFQGKQVGSLLSLRTRAER